MNICIDESGSFVYTTASESWNCVAAYAYPETSRKALTEVMNQLKRRTGINRNSELKLKNIGEDQYVWLLQKLSRLEGVLYAVANDASTNKPNVLKNHQDEQVRRLLAPLPVMQHESGRQSIRDLADKVSRLPLQLYVQMVSQVHLVLTVIHSAVLYFVQRRPQTLSRFHWRIDQKNSGRTEYEHAFSQVLPAFLQSASLKEPMPMLEGSNYSWFDRHYYPDGAEPTYLQDVYGIQDNDADQRKLNIGQIMREDVKFMDSRASLGIQVADLLASGLRRCLRGNFQSNEACAECFGKLMVQNIGKRPPIKLISLGAEDHPIDDTASRMVTIMRTHAREMLAL